jgi:hypothetical protein
MKPPSRKIRALLESSTSCWPHLRSMARDLSDDELAQADQIERLGRRRINMIRVLHAEFQCRAGREKKMLNLRAEVTR